MSRRTIGELLLMLAVLIVVPVLLAFAGLELAKPLGVDPVAYWTQAIPTLAAVIAGIPLAIAGVRLTARLSASMEKRAAEDRRRVVLLTICDELQSVERELVGDRAGRQEIIYPPLKTAGWRALSDGGDHAYHFIEAIRLLESEIREVRTNPIAHAASAANQILNELVRILLAQDEHAKAAIRQAMQALRESGMPCEEMGDAPRT